MATEPAFTPEFGPNGAVMNAPTMTPEMRAKLERASRLPTRQEYFKELGSFGMIAVPVAVALAVGGIAKTDFETILSSPWWSGAFTGVVATVAAMMITASIRFNGRRWELLVRTEHRVMAMPGWIRWAFAVTDSLATSGRVVFVAWLVAIVQRQFYFVMVSIAMFALAMFAIGQLLRWYADRRGWVWRLKNS